MSEKKSIYLDHAATTQTLDCARAAFLTAPFGNPSSEHASGQRARDALEQARERIARCIGARPNEIYFTSGATESCGIALTSMAMAGCYICFSPYEHHAATDVPFVAEKAAYNLPLKANGYVQMLAQNETGEIFSMPELDEDERALVFTDATAAAGHIPLYVRKIKADYMAFTAHKFGGVPGAAVLFVRDGAPIYPLYYGGGQEKGKRSGTENVPAICAMAAALEWQMDHMEENTQKLAAMRQLLFQSLSRIQDHKWNTPLNSPCVPHILNISFDGVDAHALAMLLSKEGVMISPGAACSNGLHEPSHVIMSMYHDEDRARSAVRLSLSHENTPDECVEAAGKITEAVKYLRSLV